MPMISWGATKYYPGGHGTFIGKMFFSNFIKSIYKFGHLFVCNLIKIKKQINKSINRQKFENHSVLGHIISNKKLVSSSIHNH